MTLANCGLLVAVAVTAVSLAFACKGLLKCGVKKACVAVFPVLSILLGVVFAHWFYCVFRFAHSWGYTVQNVFHEYSFLAIWDGHYMLYGAVVGVILSLFVVTRISAAKLVPAMDAVAPWAIPVIAAFRFLQAANGNFYGHELPWELEESAYAAFPWAVPDYYDTFHWTLFLPVILWAVLLMGFLIIKKSKKTGDTTLVFFAMYACLQCILESLRCDEVLKWGFVRYSQVISALLTLVIMVIYAKRAKKGHIALKVSAFALLFAAAAVCIVMEFVVDGKIDALQFITDEGENYMRGYIISAVGCAVMAISIFMMRSLDSALQKE